MPRLKVYPSEAASAVTRLRIWRLHASNGVSPIHRSPGNQATSRLNGMMIDAFRSGCGATSSSFTSWGTPSSAAPVNISDPSAAWTR
jgi:hypothetical protein